MATHETKDAIKANIEEAHKLLRRAHQLLDYPINATPSGTLRNKLTDINIHVMVADSACLDASRMMKEQ